MILLIDNYDSFSYNLYQLIGMIRPDIKVIRNDEMTIAEIEALAPDHIIVSPGPGRPKDAGICEEVIDYFKGKIPIFGVCLGHQAICETLGGKITYAPQLMHGKQSVGLSEENPPTRSIRLLHCCQKMQRRIPVKSTACILYIPVISWHRQSCHSSTPSV